MDVGLLRRVELLERWCVVVGGLAYLDMPEMGAVGWARVLAIEPCPPLMPGRGCLVTGTFRHSRGIVFDLVVEGEPKPIGVTELHPFWSEDRQMYVPASELRVGERLAGQDGRTPRVLSFTQRPESAPVYNIEVGGDHCYRVGEQGLLVHNSSVPNCCTPPKGEVKYHAFGTGFLPGNTRSISKATGGIAYVTPESPILKSPFNNAPWWYTKLPKLKPEEGTWWERSHLIAAQLGGTGGSNWQNMVPLYPVANDPGMENCEQYLRYLAKECGHCVSVRVTAIYKNENDLIPEQIVIIWASDQGGEKLDEGLVGILNQPSTAGDPRCSLSNLPCRKKH